MHRYFGFLIGKEVWSSSYMIHIHIHIHIAHRKALGPIGSVKATAPKIWPSRRQPNFSVD
jgi:hypothetical protein